MSVLFVFYNNKKVGELVKQADDTLSFSYSKSWLDDKENNFWLSPALKLEERAFNHRETRSFFENLLPEGTIRKQLEKTYSTSLTDDYAFLEKFGIDCAGAFIITPGEDVLREIDPEEVNKLDLGQLCTACENNENLSIHTITKHQGRFSLAGVQDKIPVIFEEGSVYVPTMGGATSHILKPPSTMPGATETVYNEYFCMKLAANIGLDVPEVDIIEAKIPLYLVKRYDRELTEQGYLRIHQFDFCQAQGFPSSEKYEEDGGPTIKSNHKAIVDFSENPPKDIDKYIDWIAFNLFIGNNDSHSKNISFVLKDGGYRVAPFYDLISTSVYSNFDHRFAFNIAGQRSWDKLKQKHFKILSKDLGFKKDENYIWNRSVNIAKNIADSIDEFKKKFDTQYSERTLINKLIEEIKKRIRIIVGQGGMSGQ